MLEDVAKPLKLIVLIEINFIIKKIIYLIVCIEIKTMIRINALKIKINQ